MCMPGSNACHVFTSVRRICMKHCIFTNCGMINWYLEVFFYIAWCRLKGPLLYWFLEPVRHHLMFLTWSHNSWCGKGPHGEKVPTSNWASLSVFFDLTEPCFTGKESSWRPFCCSSGSAGPRAELDICWPVSCTNHDTKKSNSTILLS